MKTAAAKKQEYIVQELDEYSGKWKDHSIINVDAGCDSDSRAINAFTAMPDVVLGFGEMRLATKGKIIKHSLYEV